MIKRMLIKASIASRMFIAVLIVSSVATLLITAVSSWFDYREALNDIEMRVKEIENIELPVIAENLWKMDLKTVSVTIEGILHIPGIKHVVIEDKGKVIIEAGRAEPRHVMRKEFPLFYSYADKKLSLGIMGIDIAMSGIYKELWKNVWKQLLYQGILVFFISFFIFYMFQRMVTRHLSQIAAYVKQIGTIKFEGNLLLKGKKTSPEALDELDSIVSTINLMNLSLKSAFDKLQFEITERKKTEEEREKLVNELKDALAEVKQLSGMLPICAGCKKIRDDKGYWNQIEVYIRDHSEAEFTHGLCPDCEKKAYEELDRLKKERDKNQCI